MLRLRLRLASLVALAAAGALTSVTSRASAQSAPTGAPPPEAKALVEAPKETAKPPTIEKLTDGTAPFR